MPTLWKRLWQEASALYKYGVFLIIFVLSAIIAYGWAFSSFDVDSQTLANILQIIGTASGLVFAMVTGYFAFAQFVESRFDKLVEDGHINLRKKDYQRAATNFQDAFHIRSRDAITLFNLMETILIQKKFLEFDRRINLLSSPRILVEPREQLIAKYLLPLRYLLSQDLTTAREKISELITYVNEYAKKTGSIASMGTWSFVELRKSSAYIQLDGRSKKMLDNLHEYLENSLAEKKSSFEEGNYENP